MKTKAIIYRNLWNFTILFAILFWVRIALKKFTQVLPYVVCTQVRRHVHKRITKRRYGEEKPRRFVFEKNTFVNSRSGNYYNLFLWYFRLKFLPDICHHCVYWVLAEISAPNSSHTICNKFFIHYCQGPKWRFVCLWNCLIFFLGEYSSVWSQIQSRFLRGISWKNYFRRIFQKFYSKPRLSSTETCEISP